MERVHIGNLSFAALALIVVFGSLLGIVVLQTLIVQNRVRLDEVTQELDIAREENQRLRLLEIELVAPDRILDVAIDDLGMVRPSQRRYLPGVDPAIEEIRLPPSADPLADRARNAAQPARELRRARLAAVVVHQDVGHLRSGELRG